MSEWFPQCVRIENIEKHPNADALSIATILGNYPCIIKTGEYSVGDTALYIPVDSVVPDTEQFHFLSPKDKYEVGKVPEKYRIIKAKKIRGVFSMGLLFPNTFNLSVGDSIVDSLCLTKWEEEGEENIREHGLKVVGGNAKSPPKGWAIPYYDLEGLRKYNRVIADFPDEEIVITEKLNGANFSAVYKDDELWTKSRNLYKKEDDTCMWWKVSHKYDLKTKLSKYPNLVVFGESYGQVGGYPYDRVGDTPNLRAFDIFDLTTMSYLDYDRACSILDELDIPRVPELYRGEMLSFEEINALADGQSTLNAKHIREGCVLKPVINKSIYRGERFVLKLVGQTYLLKK